MNNSTIISTGSYSPEFVVTNDDLTKIMDTSNEWILSRTGIKERRISTGENTSHLAYKASISAIEEAKLNCEDIDLIIVATITPDMHMPSTACMLQNELGAYNATAFDINAACSGFVYAINIANSLIKTKQYKTALVVGAEVLSKNVDWNDRSTAVLFGDGAGAVVIKEGNGNDGIKSLYTMSRGQNYDVLTLGSGKVKNPYVTNTLKDTSNFIEMNGREVFKFAVEVMAKSIHEVLDRANEKIEDIDWIVPHQANERIIKFVAKKLNMDEKKFYMNLERFGNTSSASIPIALDEMNKKNILKKGNKIILVGFGGGLTYGAALIEW